MAISFSSDDRLLTAAEVDRILGSPPGRKYALMKRPWDAFPDVIKLGRSSRWLASAVYAWIERQITQSGEIKMHTTHQMPTSPEKRVSPGAAAPATDIAAMRTMYETGASLDETCREFRISKTRLSKLLKEVGTTIRKPGRKPETVLSSGLHVQRSPWPSYRPSVTPRPHESTI